MNSVFDLRSLYEELLYLYVDFFDFYAVFYVLDFFVDFSDHGQGLGVAGREILEH